MRRLTLIVTAMALLGTACDRNRTSTTAGRPGMQMDSTYEKDAAVTLVHPKDSIRLGESMKDFKDNPNITRSDLDAEKKVASAGITYVKSGDKLRLGEAASGR